MLHSRTARNGSEEENSASFNVHPLKLVQFLAYKRSLRTSKCFKTCRKKNENCYIMNVFWVYKERVKRFWNTNNPICSTDHSRWSSFLIHFHDFDRRCSGSPWASTWRHSLELFEQAEERWVEKQITRFFVINLFTLRSLTAQSASVSQAWEFLWAFPICRVSLPLAWKESYLGHDYIELRGR